MALPLNEIEVTLLLDKKMNYCLIEPLDMESNYSREICLDQLFENETCQLEIFNMMCG